MNASTESLLLFGIEIIGDRSISPIQGLGALTIVYAVAMFIGLVICSQLRWGFGITSFPLDAVKCLGVGAVVILAAFFINAVLIPLTGVPHIMLFMFAVIYLTSKACWRDLRWQESLLSNGLAVLASGTVLFFIAERVAT